MPVWPATHSASIAAHSRHHCALTVCPTQVLVPSTFSYDALSRQCSSASRCEPWKQATYYWLDDDRVLAVVRSPIPYRYDQELWSVVGKADEALGHGRCCVEAPSQLASAQPHLWVAKTFASLKHSQQRQTCLMRARPSDFDIAHPFTAVETELFSTSYRHLEKVAQVIVCNHIAPRIGQVIHTQEHASQKHTTVAKLHAELQWNHVEAVLGNLGTFLVRFASNSVHVSPSGRVVRLSAAR